MQPTRLKVLQIEDEENDVLIVRLATEKCGAIQSLQAVSNGKEATLYLLAEGRYADRERFPYPSLILCDLRMPCMDGFEFLRWRRTDAVCSLIPTIVFSSSDNEADVLEAYRLGANSYLVKPSGLTKIVTMLRTTFDFWSSCQHPEATPSPGPLAR